MKYIIVHYLKRSCKISVICKQILKYMRTRSSRIAVLTIREWFNSNFHGHYCTPVLRDLKKAIRVAVIVARFPYVIMFSLSVRLINCMLSFIASWSLVQQRAFGVDVFFVSDYDRNIRPGALEGSKYLMFLTSSIEPFMSQPRLRCHPEVTSDQTKSNAHSVFPDQNYRVWDLVPAHNSMIRGHFGLGMVWSEVTSVWWWSDQRSLRCGDGLIRGHFGLGMVWSEVTSVWGWSDQRSLRSGDGLIRGHFGLGMVTTNSF